MSNGRPVSSKEVSLAEAKAIKGLRAVFGEVRSAGVVCVCMCVSGGRGAGRGGFCQRT